MWLKAKTDPEIFVGPLFKAIFVEDNLAYDTHQNRTKKQQQTNKEGSIMS